MRATLRVKFLIVVGSILAVSFGCARNPSDSILPLQPTYLPENEFIEQDLPNGFGYVSRYFEVYFTDPHNPQREMKKDGLDRLLATAIDQARVSLDIAIYSLDDHVISFAIIRAKEKGVSVRVAVEGDNMDSDAIQNLITNGIEVKADVRSGLMHNKFMIIDGIEVWTGSMNYTYSSIYDDHNSLVRVRSAEIAENYEVEFLELFEGNASSNTPYPKVIVGGFTVENYFSPDDRFAYRMVELLNSIDDSARFMMYTFTADDYSEVLIKKASDGLEILGVMESSTIEVAGSDFKTMQLNGIDLKAIDDSGVMHHKTMILDSKTVIFGSYNFTASAEKKNDENILVINSPQLAELFLMEFERVNSPNSK